MSEDAQSPEASYHWQERAAENVEKWGEQSVETLLLASMEELGELTQAVLEHRAEGGDRERIQDELDDLMALGYQMKWRLEDG